MYLRILKKRIVFFLMAFLLSFTGKGVRAYAAEAANDLYEQQSTGDLIWKMLLPEKNAINGYQALGITLHRSDKNGEEMEDEYVRIPFSETQEGEENGHPFMTARIFNSDIAAAIHAYGNTEWEEEWNSGKTGTLYVNAVLTVYHYENGVKILNGTFDSSGYHGEIYDFGSGIDGTGTYRNMTGEYTFTGDMGNPLTYFQHRRYIYNTLSAQADDPRLYRTEDAVTYGYKNPHVYAWNTSSQYNVGEGIPAGSTLTAGFFADRWFGTYTAEKMPVQTKTYHVTIIARGHRDIPLPVKTGGNQQVNTKTEEWSTAVTENVTRSASYYAVRNADIYRLKAVRVRNGAYDLAEFTDFSDTESITPDVLVNGETVSDENTDSDPDRHIEWPDESSLVVEVEVPEHRDKMTEEEVRTYFASNQLAEDKVGNVTAHNDRIVINGITYLDDTPVTGKHIENSMPEPADINDDEYGYETGTKNVVIPPTRQNGRYKTTVQGYYERIFPADGQQVQTEYDGDKAIITDTAAQRIEETDKRPDAGMNKNEPVVVHSPVAADARITGSNGTGAGNTQLVKPASDADRWDYDLRQQGITTYNLLLDSRAVLSFEPYKWLSESTRDDGMGSTITTNDTVKSIESPNGKTGYVLKGIENEDMFDSYTASREVRFPFDVELISHSTGDRTLYKAETADPDSGMKYTDWISLQDNSADIYIPAWDIESVVMFGLNNKTNYYKVEFRVTGRNPGSGSAENSSEDIENSALKNYIATFTIPVNISGSVSNFRIVGVSDGDMYGGYDESIASDVPYSFSIRQDERYAGSKDRTGTGYMHGMADGLLRNNLTDRSLLPLRDGSSSIYKGMGALWKGTEFSFAFDTIGNYQGDNDYAVIKPTLRYYKEDGTEDQNVKFYYSTGTGTGSRNFIEFGTSRDITYGSMSFKSPLFDGSYRYGNIFTNRMKNVVVSGTEDDIAYTAGKYGITEEALRAGKEKVYSLSEITLKKGQRLYTGSSDALSENNSCDRDSGLYSPHNDGSWDLDKLHQSMQTWYGTYCIPNKFYVADAGADLVKLGKEGRLSTDSDIFKKSGYVVVNFDITIYKNGNPTLSYYKGDVDMWAKQGALTTAGIYETGSQTNDNIHSASYRKHTINLQSGDVAIYNIRYSISDKKRGELFY